MVNSLVLFASLIACALVAVSAVPTPALDGEWQLFKSTHNKQYPTEAHESARREIWESNLAKINTHNLRYSLGQETYEVGMNHLGDITAAEMKLMLNGFKPSKHQHHRIHHAPANFRADNVTVDWRTKGIVTPVKDQGQCGSCWAFSVTGTLEGQHALATGKLVSLSESQMVDCSDKFGNQGCNGGLPSQGYKYLISVNGSDTEDSYPYTPKDGKCKASTATIGSTIKSYVSIAKKDENALADAITKIGPISVGIDASQTGFQFYKSGIYYSSSCSQTQLDHGVLAVGMGEDTTGTTGQYYIVKNSWGGAWGNKGYLLMSRGRNNNCGIATDASYPVV